MESQTIIIIALLILLGILMVAVVMFMTSGKNSAFQQIMKSTNKDSIGGKFNDPELEKILEQTRKKNSASSEVVTLEQKLFRAGMFGQKERADFQRFRILAPLLISPILGLFFASFTGSFLGILGGIVGLGIGAQLPTSWLDRRIKSRGEEIMFYLPLVIEQISIGVSSSLDVGPCLQRVVQMADERDTHNVVTELLKYAQNYIKSGVPFEEAMVETGKASGHTELKHAFMYLAQVAKHGGEITRQLQELAESVGAQRQAYVEGKIKQLELVATGPVTLVFFGFMIILMVGFGIKLGTAF